jgi:gamma-glutamyl hercynylcysteine S-oxide synthase
MSCVYPTQSCVLPLVSVYRVVSIIRPTTRRVCVAILVLVIVWSASVIPVVARADSSAELARHLAAIAKLPQSSPIVNIPEGWFLMGTTRKDDNPYGMDTQFDDTELPQRRVWLDAYAMDRDEVSIAEYLAHVYRQYRHPPEELQRLIWHVITVHYMPDYVIASWPVLYVTWAEATDFCHAQGKRLPTEAEWEKAARGSEGNLFPWGHAKPEPGLAVFGQYHVHEIPLVAAVNSGEEGQSPYGLRHMAGNVAEWLQDWFGFDYYAIMPDRNPPGPSVGRYKGVRGGSWKSRPNLLRAATRNGGFPDQRSATVGFRCAKSGS